jgi:2Fe-2S ferredoxin
MTMPLIHLISHEGVTEQLEVPEGHSVMQAAVAAGVRGIVGECGGSAMCATCHVYIDPAWLDRLRPALPNELEMLECTASQRRPESRLACQVKAQADLDGMVVRLPATQQ